MKSPRFFLRPIKINSRVNQRVGYITDKLQD